MKSPHSLPPSPQPSPLQGEGAAVHTLSPKGRGQGEGRWQPYPAYMDSGVEWLGNVPEHWVVQKLKYRARVSFSSVDKHTLDGEVSVLLCNYVDVYKNEFITDDLEFMNATATVEEVRRFSLQPGDVIVTKDSESWDDIAVPAYNLAELPGVLCGYHLALIRSNPNMMDGRFLFRSFQATANNYQFQIAANGITRYGLGKYSIDNGIFLIPPINEQRSIAAFLDHETAKIDTLIAKKQRLIELLHEKRTALISQAVTRGLDPDAPLKDSGVAWLGQVPAHWSIKKLKYIVQKRADAIKTGPFGSQLLSSEMTNGPIKVYNQQNVIEQDLTIGNNYISHDKFNELHSFEIFPGDILVTTRGTIGRCIFVGNNVERGILHPCLLRVMLDVEKFIPEYLILLIQDSRIVLSQLQLMSNATTIDVIYSGSMRQVLILEPDIDEQRRIFHFITNETAKIDAMISKVQSAIERLQEYRTALISAAVTGKIDVRRPSPQPSPLQGEGDAAIPPLPGGERAPERSSGG